MKTYRLLAVVCTGLVLSGIGLVERTIAQDKGERGVTRQGSLARSKKVPLATKTFSLREILQERKAGTLAPTDPSATTTPITLGVPITDSLANGDCVLGDGTLIDFYDFQGTSGQAISTSMTSGAFDTYLYLLDDQGNIIDENDDSGDTSDSRIPIDGGVMTLPYTGDYIIGANSFSPSIGVYTVGVNSDAACAPMPLFYNQTVSGSLASSDCAVNISDDPYFTDLYTFHGAAGKQITILMSSTAVDSYLFLHTPSGTGSIDDDDDGGGNDARIPASGTFTLPETGTYTIEASSFGPAEAGNYTLNIVGPTTGSISGVVLTPGGAGLRSGTVSLIDPLGVTLRVTTSAFGFYSFSDVPTNVTYTITVSSKRYRFASQSLAFNDDVTDVNFVGLE